MCIRTKWRVGNCQVLGIECIRGFFLLFRTITLTFEPGKRLRTTSVEILEDYLPENTETFFVTLSNPTGGATIGTKNKITVNILSNDNAHGIIEFAEVVDMHAQIDILKHVKLISY